MPAWSHAAQPGARRAVLALLGLAAAWPAWLQAQDSGKPWRVAFLAAGSAPRPGQFSSFEAITAGLLERGFSALQTQAWYGAGRADTLPAQAQQVLAWQPDVIVTNLTLATLAAHRATRTIPIVMAGSGDPVATGLVQSLARPGNNLSGVLIAADGTLVAKKMELLKEAVPRATRIAFLSPEDPAMQVQIAETRQAATALGLELSVVTARGGDYAGAFAAIMAERAQAVFVAAQTTFMTDRKPIIELALRHKLPTVWEWAEQVRDGGLMAYGTSLSALYDRVATYIDRVLRGARIGDLPIEQPTTFGLVMNQGTARAIGLSLPRPLLLRADEVVG
jgi:putative ABC transport system substrate-binding protein